MVRPEVKKRRREVAARKVESRKKVKKLEKVVLNKKSKVNRSRLLAELKECQLQPDQIDQLHSTSSMQTKGLKKFMNNGTVPTPRAEQRDALSSQQARQHVSLLKRKRKRRANIKHVISDTSSEDTDAVSTDTEIYYATNATVAQSRETKPKPAVYVPVSRDPKVEQSRLELPIIGEEQNIIERIRYNDVVVVSGETGSGKTTQIPQFLYEAGYTLDGSIIGITEPRRVAAVSMSERVAHELNLTSDQVSYQIRYSGNTTASTKIKFMTDGVLLKECQQDLLLNKYSVIIIDEAHERSMFSDILIGLLSRIVLMRRRREKPLKLVIMSATLKVDDFKKNKILFKIEPPLISINARQHKVTMQFSRKTPTNYLKAAYQKVCSVHSKYSKNSELKGGILVFVTSQMDVKVLCTKLSSKFPLSQTSHSADLSEWSEASSESDSANEGLISTSNPPLFCLGLYAMLPLEKQKLVFKEPPEGSRLCVVATNVAETSITIPNIKYVIDTGKEKTKVYDKENGVSRYVTGWTSKSSAEQRMGRAGRMGAGYCYRLYSSAVFMDQFPEHATPHILQKPIEDVLLQMKSMGIDNVVNFPFPFLETPRDLIESLKTAETKLILLGALQDTSKTLTSLGKAMANIAVDARYSKMIVTCQNFTSQSNTSQQMTSQSILSHVISLVSALSVREIFAEGSQWREMRKKWAGHGNCKLLGDYMVKLKAVSTTIKEAESCKNFCLNKHCIQNGLHYKAMLEIDKLRKHLMNEINHGKDINQNYTNIDEQQSRLIRQLLLSSYCDHVARRLPDGFIEEKNDKGQTVKKKLKNAYESMESDQPVYISPESILKADHPEYIIYKEIYQGDKKRYMRDIAVVEPGWLPQCGPKLCSFGGSDVQPTYDKVSGKASYARPVFYGPHNWPLGLFTF